MSFRVETGEFAGPLSVLLELVDAQKLAITQISLAKVADDFVRYLDEHTVPAFELADFLLVASRLIYLKSRELVPYLVLDDEEAGAKKLEEQLRIYREFVHAAERLDERFMASPCFARTLVRPVREAAFFPPKTLTQTLLHDVYNGVLKRLEPFFALRETSMERVKSIEERLREMTSAVKSRASMHFRDAVAGARSKADVVVTFLALLELLRRGIVRAKQGTGHGDIEIERV